MELIWFRQAELVVKTAARTRCLLPALTLSAGMMLAIVLGAYLHRQPLFQEVTPAPPPASGIEVQTCLDQTPRSNICFPGQEVAPPALEKRARLMAHRCALGRWFHSPVRRLAEESNPELRARFAALDKLHLNLHRAGLAVEAYLARGDRLSAINHQRQYTLPLLDQMVHSLSALQQEVDKVCVKETNPGSCSRKFEILYTNLGGTLCGIRNFHENIRDSLTQPSQGGAPLNTTPLSAR